MICQHPLLPDAKGNLYCSWCDTTIKGEGMNVSLREFLEAVGNGGEIDIAYGPDMSQAIAESWARRAQREGYTIKHDIQNRVYKCRKENDA